MLEILRCDSCNKPLGPAAVKRDEASERGDLVVCRSCLFLESSGTELPISPNDESRAKWKLHHADMHASAIMHIKEAKAAERAERKATKEAEARAKRKAEERKKRKERERQEALKREPSATIVEVDEDTAPLDEVGPAPKPKASKLGAPILKVVGADGNTLAGRLRQGPNGELMVEVDPSGQLRPPANAPLAVHPMASRPRPSMGRAALGARPSAYGSAELSGRRFNVAAAALFLGVVLVSLGFSIYIALNAQKESNAARNADGKTSKSDLGGGGYNKEEANKTSEIVAKTSGNEGKKTHQPDPIPEPPKALEFPLEVPSVLADRMHIKEESRSKDLIMALRSEDLETRLNALSSAMRGQHVKASTTIETMLASEHASERQLACEALGHLMAKPSLPALRRVKDNAEESAFVRLAASRALSRLTFQSHMQELEGWTLQELEELEASLKRNKGNEKSLKIVQRAIRARKERK